MRMEDIKLDYSDVLIRPKRSTLKSRKEVSLKRVFTFRNSRKTYEGVPIMAANMDGVGTPAMHQSIREQGLFTCLVKHLPKESLVTAFRQFEGEHLAYSLGISESDMEKYEAVKAEAPIHYVCIDVANGYSEHFIHFVARFREANPNVVLIAGNVVTGDVTEELILNGVDVVKVGIGPGSVCTTRIKTGVGYPQLSAVMECADAAHGLGGHIIADGGCVSPGDVAKAFAAGADFVMLGGMLAGHDEGGQPIVTRRFQTNEVDEDGNPVLLEKSYVTFYGMSSVKANDVHLADLRNTAVVKGERPKSPTRVRC